MNRDIVNSKQTTFVTSAGNAWVVCDSKSRPGFKYYFNTFSGQSVWNLSPEEIEKAKTHTKGLPISEIEKCPEPAMDPPIDRTVIPPQAGVPRIYHDPFVRQIPNMFPTGVLNVPSIPRVSNIGGLNPCIWSNPPNNQTVTPVIYVAYPQMNFQQSQEYPPNFSTHVKQETNRQEYNNIENDMFNGNNRMPSTIRPCRQMQINVQQTSSWNSPDLRHKLTRKRSKSVSFDPVPVRENNDFQSKNKNKPVQIHAIETPSKYDLSVLEQLKTPHSRASVWAIVVDTEIILKNFPFLDRITDPEQNCYLVVPDHVMKELEELVRIRGDVQTRRIVRFLSQQIEADLVMKGEKITSYINDDASYKMLTTCEGLADRNSVILLSNDVKYQRYKNSNSDLHIFTWNELIRILESTPLQTNKSPIKTKSSTSLKPRGLKTAMPIKTTHQEEFVLRRRPATPDFENRSFSQTEKDAIHSQSVPSYTQISENQGKAHNTHQKTQESVEITKRPKTPSLNSEKSGKEIRLSRRTSYKTNNEVPQTRKYRWRARRTSNSKEKSKTSSVVSDQTTSVESKPQENIDNKIMEIMLRPATPDISPPRASSLCRSSTCSNKGTNRPHIVVEETSTSGVISNTTMDSDNINTYTVQKKTVSVCEDVEFELFEVVGDSMDEVLRTRRDEWVLRFVQIMEETLKEILRADSPFQNKCYDYTPPLAADLPELARSIIKKFSDHFNVVDAANRLSFKVQKISDTEGANIEPKQYMEMYSFGVYLIRSLKNVTEDCEDLNAADESLKKLLYDIQNANLDGGHHDDELNESSIVVTKPLDAEQELPGEFSDSREKKSNEEDTSILSTFNRKQVQIDKSLKLPNIEMKFFSSLELKKRTSPVKPISKSSPVTFDFPTIHSTPNTLNIAQTPPQVSSSPKAVQSSPCKQTDTDLDVSEDNKNISKTNDINLDTMRDNADDPPKICFVRNFNSIPQFEMKLKKKLQRFHQFNNNINNMQLTVSNEDPTEQFFDDDEYDDAYDNYDDVDEAYDNELEEGEIIDDASDLIDPVNEENSRQQANNEFEWFIGKFTDEIKRTIKAVCKLCEKLRGEMKNSLQPSQEIQNELRIASTSLNTIKSGLDSILEDSTSSEKDIARLLKKANIRNFVPTEELLLKYRYSIGKCRDEVNMYHETLTRIMQVARIPQLA